MLPPCFVIWVCSVGTMVLGAGVASGQDYPNKPVRIVTTEPGGNSDFNARLIAQGLSSALGQPVIVENRAGTIVAPETAAKATPDGYTVLVTGSVFWVGPLLQKMPYDPVKDFSPIMSVVRSPNVLVVHPSVQAKSVKELIALAKAKPGALNYAAAATGSPPHLAGELFKVMAGVNIVGIPYKSAGPALNDMVGGQVQLMFGSATSVAPHLKSGRLNALAVTSAEPSALFPDLPTVAASLPGYQSGSLTGMWAPTKTPATVIKRLNQETTRFLSRTDIKERFLSIGAEAAPSTPEQFAAVIKSEIVRMGKLIKDAGIKLD